MNRCVDCKHFRGKPDGYKPGRFDLSRSTCAWRGVRTVCGVTGKVWENRTTAWIERRASWWPFSRKCGPTGRRFEAKP